MMGRLFTWSQNISYLPSDSLHKDSTGALRETVKARIPPLPSMHSYMS
jgi:hypothetical protein